mgnify:CR=1 FL=1
MHDENTLNAKLGRWLEANDTFTLIEKAKGGCQASTARLQALGLTYFAHNGQVILDTREAADAGKR